MALVSTLIDNFNDNSMAGVWTTGLSFDGSQVTEKNQRIEVTHAATSQYNALSSATTYDLTSTTFYAQLINAGNQALVSHEAIIGFQLATNANALWFTVSGNFISAWKRVAGVQTQVASSIAYTSATHQYFRLREASGTIFWEWSTNGTTGWTNPTSWSLANPFAITAITPFLQSGCWQNEASASLAYFDNFNTTGTATTIPSLMLMGVGV